KLDLLYNYAVMSLHTGGNPRVISAILTSLTEKMYTRNPRMWIRLAELKIQEYLKLVGSSETFDEYTSKRRNHFVQGHAAEGPHRKLKLKQPRRVPSEAEELLQQARVYAQNALLV